MHTKLFFPIFFSILLFSSCSKQPDVIKLGATFPLTGEVASYGVKAQRGIQLALDEQNAKGGILGKQVQIDFQDDRNDKKEAVSIVNKFATIDHLPLIFGSAGSSATLAVTPIINQNNVVLISPISSSSLLSKEGGSFFFRTVPADDIQAKVLAGWVFKHGATNVAVVYTNNSWGKPLADGFEEKFKELGGNVLLSEGTNENSTDFRPIILKLKKLTNLDAIVSPTYPKEGGALVKQLKELGAEKILFGGDNWGSPEFISIAGNAAEGAFYTAPAKSTSPLFEDFAKRYEAKFGEKPDVFGAYSFDAATAAFKSIEKAQNVESVKIQEALREISFMGVSGEIRFTSTGDLATEGFDKMTIKNGKPEKIKE